VESLLEDTMYCYLSSWDDLPTFARVLETWKEVAYVIIQYKGGLTEPVFLVMLYFCITTFQFQEETYWLFSELNQMGIESKNGWWENIIPFKAIWWYSILAYSILWFNSHLIQFAKWSISFLLKCSNAPLNIRRNTGFVSPPLYWIITSSSLHPVLYWTICCSRLYWLAARKLSSALLIDFFVHFDEVIERREEIV